MILTSQDIGDGPAFDAMIDDAFPGSRVDVEVNEGYFGLTLKQHGLLRPLSAAAEGALVHRLEKALGETVVPNATPPPWAWSTR